MSKRLVITFLLSITIVAVLSAIAFASYRPLDKNPVALAPVKLRLVVDKITIRVIKYRAPKPVKAGLAPAARKPVSQAPATSGQSPARPVAEMAEKPTKTHSSGNSDEGDEEYENEDEESEEHYEEEEDEESDD